MTKKIAYCSDLHLDFFFKERSNIQRALDYNFSKYFQDIDSDTLIIAGDTSHFTPEYETECILELKQWLNLKNVITVNGNHSGYRLTKQLQQRFANGLQLMAFRTDLYNQNGIHALEGNYVEIDGVRIGGCDSFYDGTIYYRMNQAWMYGTSGTLEDYWKRTMNDSKNMKLDSFWEYAKQQKDLLRRLKDQVDVMVTHVNPCADDVAFPKMYKNDMTNAFYSFDFEEEIMLDDRLRYWIFGHTHTPYKYSLGNVSLVTSPRGYPNEVYNKTIDHLEVVVHKHYQVL